VTAGPPSHQPTTYAHAGVDIAAGERAVELIKDAVSLASRPEVLGGLGGFAGLFALDLTRWRRPVLAAATDGVGTKLAIAQALDRHDTVGIDLVAMVVDDLVVCGAEPLFLTDYLACGRVVPERVATIVGGIAAGCAQAGCALIGGETAEHPGLLAVEDYDLSASGVGVVEADRVLGPERVGAGEAVIAMASSGLHANGYSLVRHILRGVPMDNADLGSPLGDVLLAPTRIYARDCLALAATVDVHAFAHITGGGLAANLARVLPPTVDAVLDRATWSPPAICAYLAERGAVPRAEMERTFNQGVGMVAVLAAADADAAISLLAERGVPAWLVGQTLPGSGTAALTGRHRDAATV